MRKIYSSNPSSETVNMLNTSMEEITTSSSSRYLKGFKKLADSISTIKTKLYQEDEKKSLLQKRKESANDKKWRRNRLYRTGGLKP